MAMRDELNQPNDRLLTNLMKVTAVAPRYSRRTPAGGLTLNAVTVYVDPEFWPPPADQQDALKEWAAGKCGLIASGVTLAPGMGGA